MPKLRKHAVASPSFSAVCAIQLSAVLTTHTGCADNCHNNVAAVAHLLGLLSGWCIHRSRSSTARISLTLIDISIHETDSHIHNTALPKPLRWPRTPNCVSSS